MPVDEEKLKVLRTFLQNHYLLGSCEIEFQLFRHKHSNKAIIILTINHCSSGSRGKCEQFPLDTNKEQGESNWKIKKK